VTRRRITGRAIAIVASAALASVAVACGAFSSEPPQPPAPLADAAPAPAPDAGPDAPAATVPIRCGYRTCPADGVCCLPLDRDLDAGCIERGAVCGPRHGELRCSDPTACGAGEVCCVTATRGAGQQTFEITRSFCVAAAACPDAELQHQLCALGEGAQCPGRACKPYLRDVNGQKQDLDVVPTGYAICQ
jgi:hypothetical protein